MSFEKKRSCALQLIGIINQGHLTELNSNLIFHLQHYVSNICILHMLFCYIILNWIVFCLIYLRVWMIIFQDKLEDSAYSILMDYHTATVTLLALMSAATDDVSRNILHFCWSILELVSPTCWHPTRVHL